MRHGDVGGGGGGGGLAGGIAALATLGSRLVLSVLSLYSVPLQRAADVPASS